MWGNDPMYVQSEGIQLTALLTIRGSLGKKFLLKRVGILNLEEWSKCGVTKKIKFCQM